MGAITNRTAILVSLMVTIFATLVTGPAHASPNISGGGTRFAVQSQATGNAMVTTGDSGNLPEFGTQFHGLWSSYSDIQRAMVLDTLKANGVTTVRVDVSWAMLQPKGAEWDSWGTKSVTSVLNMITDRGLAPMVMVWMTPSWVTGSTDERVPPQTADQLNSWETFTEGLAARFPQVTDWEVWNEPNSTKFMRGASPSVYAQVLASAYKGIKAGNPSSRVIFAGTEFVDTPWIIAALKSGAQGHFDIMGVHPYMAVGNLSPDSPDNDGIWRLRHIPTLRKAMLAMGESKPMWFTEFGWRVGNAGAKNWQLGVDEATQAKYLADTLRIVKAEYPYVTRVYWYRDLADNNTSTSSGYGLVEPDGSVKPALAQIPSIYAAG